MGRNCENDLQQILSLSNLLRLTDTYIFYIGGFEVRKNTALMLRAFSKLAKHYASNLKDKILVIGGEAPKTTHPLLDDVKGIAKTLGIENRVKFVGRIKDNDLPAFYSEADFFIFPSLYEGFGLPVLEAMASGTPVIASQTGAIKEVAQDTVLYFHPEREDELVQNMNRFLTDEALKEELRVKALNRSRRFNWKDVAVNLLDEIKKCKK